MDQGIDIVALSGAKIISSKQIIEYFASRLMILTRSDRAKRESLHEIEITIIHRLLS